MKQFRYLVIGALFTLMLVTSCEKDPVPPVYDCRVAKAFHSVGSIPDNMRGNNVYHLFSTDDKAYVLGRANTYNNLALYEYNSTDNQWNIVWSVDQDFQPSGGGNSQQELEEYQRQQQICNYLATALYQQGGLASCAFNGKGYCFLKNTVMEFNLQAYSWSLKSSYGLDSRNIISTTQGIFQVGYNGLSKYDIAANRWNVEGNIPSELQNQTDVFTSQDRIYIFQEKGLLGIYSSSNQQWEVIEHGIDFSSYQNDLRPSEENYGAIKTNFVLNNKYYFLYDHRYYEYNLDTRSTSVILLSENTYFSQINQAFVANNKAFLIGAQNEQLMELIP